ncbi:hypothetical protein [Cupriavidus sp. SK-3]|uniref:hypothetical protein n=1 Tax=Cupriavidus sp. SK-3 TaxID=1470558 RepID=UPI001268C172|nr:hypothetical protein [Cupriavidus sp. SK-3]
MNWYRLYASLQIWFVVCLSSAFGAGCWSFVAAGLCRMAFELGDNESMLLVGLPLFVILFVVFIKFLPEPLRRAGLLSEKPERFGPWLKQNNND